MAIQPDEIKGQIDRSCKALLTMTAAERKNVPNRHFLDNYNNLLKLAKDSFPEASNDRWPPEITDTANYIEILAYLEQCSQILSEGVEPFFGVMG
ncbi:hypothetical protein ACA877_004655 [Vibrio alginolyticus]|uniref:hypothetical protein n=1 Tax=Vibrio alginolyticus TaxID=663 RepID=UPI0011EEFDC5|nr:hypothetical protein [Vibrio alginolyticus]ELA8079165.1 hypothetical protein [Vibrio alginolyticus]ELA8176087.1 hypothetical protein [Vibrio alginolyticus]TYZ34216.1 hypothetical protein EWT61_24080 [Vibrio alginolyticus]